MPFEELKQRQSVMWGTGPYQRITETIPDIHERVIDRLDPQPGARLLDLASGTGAVASVCGVMFTLHHAASAREIARVTKLAGGSRSRTGRPPAGLRGCSA